MQVEEIGTQTILVVDGSAEDRRLVGDLLKDPNWTVVYAANGLDALEQLATVGPDLVVTDLATSEVDGLQLVCELRNASPPVPVILMTSQGNEETAVQALQQGAASYVPKRRLAQDLADTVKQVLAASRQELNQSQLIQCLTGSEYSFVLENDPELVLSIPSYLQRNLRDMRMCADATQRMRVGIALEEALANALYHGNLEIGSDLREEDDAAYYELIRQRRSLPPFRDRMLHVNARITQSEAVFVIRDEGPGFDVSSLPDPTAPDRLHRPYGRGVLLIRTFMDEVRYNDAGNEITLIKRAS